LGTGGDVLVNGQVGKKGFDLGRPHFAGVALAVEKDEAFDPVGVCLLGAQAKVAQPGGGTDTIQESRLSHGREARGKVLS
jgi:hypothetical protein